MDKTEIYYFSGTGNSLYIAKELQKRISEAKLTPIVSLLDLDVIKTNGSTVGFVFPVHAITIPVAVKRFLKKVDLSSADYIFAVATRGGTIFRGFDEIEKILKKKKKSLDSHFVLNMGMNDPKPKGYKCPTEADILKFESLVQEKLDLIQNIILNKEISKEKDTGYLIEFEYHPLINSILEKLAILGLNISEYIGGVNYFYPDSNCNGCGICKKVCLSGKVKMEHKKPVWQKNVFCYMCYACVNFCPQKSVQINDIPFVKSYTEENERYSCPYATPKDIKRQKFKGEF
ncbi:EFR1 family ferrodoxin [Methanobacterium sp. ACI-7]|uniref:EFR1 family ferrodoxin n=1 Tax=unclassified Methanobacterium TaxID=2627676 RepID=UPI0039C164F1